MYNHNHITITNDTIDIFLKPRSKRLYDVVTLYYLPYFDYLDVDPDKYNKSGGDSHYKIKILPKVEFFETIGRIVNKNGYLIIIGFSTFTSRVSNIKKATRIFTKAIGNIFSLESIEENKAVFKKI